jgi:hypothetical protein
MTIARCPTCGAIVRVVSGYEGTSHYEPVTAIDAQGEIAALTTDRDRAWQTINEIETALAAHGIAVTAPLVDAILPLLERGQSAQSEAQSQTEGQA